MHSEFEVESFGRAKRVLAGIYFVVAGQAMVGCSGNAGSLVATAESCMRCHNGSLHDDYSGPGMENPHPLEGVATILCTGCHGGNPDGVDALGSHVPAPPEIGDRDNQDSNAHAYFNRLTQTGIDRFPDYQVAGVDYTALDYLQFINPGDIRVTQDGRGCGECHQAHVETFSQSITATSAGIFSGAAFASGVENEIPGNQGLWQDTAADLGFRDIVNDDYVFDATKVGAVRELVEFPVFSTRNVFGPRSLHNSDDYLSADLADDQLANGQVITDSPLDDLYHEQTAFTCGDCHYGSSGANNRYGDFRSAGCSACHMPYSLDGVYRGTDPNVRRDEPADPDNIRAPERPHVKRHLVTSIAKTLPSGEEVQGINDYACAGCHQGSNRTVMQYWGIRLDQNQDVRRGNQYPANPVSYQNTSGDTRLFDALVGNNTFNGRNRNQYLAFEDYDGDNRDDTPADVHYEAGMACIDCHGSFDAHGGDVTDPDGADIYSRMEHGVAIDCEDCHGTADAYAATAQGVNYKGETVDLGVDSKGNPMRHVQLEADGNYYMYSRLDGAKHYLVQTKDTVVDSGKTHPFSGEEIYSQKASYCMGRNDGQASTGLGPQQTGNGPNGFSHVDNMSCVSCHASWTNNCVGCHLEGEYNTGNNFSNITGDRIVFRERNADFIYQSPLFFQLGVDTEGKITPMSPNTETFFKYEDRNNVDSKVFAFSDRKGKGGDRSGGGFPALSHNTMMPHSIRGKVTPTNEGPRYCVSCHLTDEGMANYGAEYTALRTALADPSLTGLDNNMFQTLKAHIGQNPGNQLNSPLWVHMVSGLGSGLFLMDENGAPVNPLDTNDDRAGSGGVAPAITFDLANVAYNLDRMVEPDGSSNSSSNHPMQQAGIGTVLRLGADNPNMSGPLGSDLIRKLTDPATGIVLDSWIDADGNLGGSAGTFVTGP